MGHKFWVFRATKVFIVILAILFIIQLLKQHSIEDAIVFALTWSFLTTSVFIGSRLYQSRKGVACELCNDTPESTDKDN